MAQMNNRFLISLRNKLLTLTPQVMIQNKHSMSIILKPQNKQTITKFLKSALSLSRFFLLTSQIDKK